MKAAIASRMYNAGWAICIALLVLVGILFIANNPDNIPPDCSLHLTAGQLILDGHLPFVDIFDTNPPMAMYIAVIPAFIARAGNFNAIVTFNQFSYLVGVLSILAFCFILVKYLNRPRGLAITMGVVWLFLFLYIVMNENFLGQRELFYSQLIMPFLLIRLGRWTSCQIPTPLALICGFGAGIVLCFKHYFFIPVILIEMMFLIRKRDLRQFVSVEYIAVAAVGAAFVGHIMLIPEIRRGFLTEWLPLIWNGYSIYKVPIPTDVYIQNIIPIMSTLIFAVFALAREAPKDKHILLLMTVFSVGGLAVYHIQHFFWPYHLIPTIWGCCGAFSALLYYLGTELKHRYQWNQTYAAAACIAVVACLFQMWFMPVESNSGIIYTFIGSSAIANIAFIPMTISARLSRRATIYLLLLVLMAFETIYYLSGNVSYEVNRVVSLVTLVLTFLCVVKIAATNGGKVSTGKKRRNGLFPVWISLTICLLFALSANREKTNRVRGFPVLANYVRVHTEPEQYIMSLGPGVLPAFTFITQYKLLPASRYLVQYPINMYNNLWVDGMKYSKSNKSLIRDKELEYILSINHDLIKNKPNLVLIHNDLKMHGLSSHFNIYNYLKELNDNMILFTDYKMIGTIDNTIVLKKIV